MVDLVVTLPWPSSALSPNTRQHWAMLAKAKRSYRQACWAAAISQGVRRVQAEGLAVDLRFVPPDRRKYDIDNLLARMKSGLDGLADILGVDDSRWSISIERAAEPVKGGEVQVTIRPDKPPVQASAALEWLLNAPGDARNA